MRSLLDTDTCIAVIRGRGERVLARLRRRRVGTVGISSITLAELEFGVANSSDPARNAVALARFCAPLEICPFGGEAASRYGRVRAALKRARTPIGPLDTLIAAHALALHATAVTGNEREFRRVPGLRVENWLTR
ncbi:MAG: type II toxin-antitoxin system VapC family toxin [Phycisphaerales bacterium]|nr:MAG: type II toxin-antitoxin system VapC family toxin [Phycisphaerales bacterium]